jgi:Tfp pilus assembly protein PilF
MERKNTSNFNFCGLTGAWLAFAMAGIILLGVWGCSRPWTSRSGATPPDGFMATIRPGSQEPDRLLRNAHYFQMMGRADLALKELEEAYALDPHNLKVINDLTRSYEALGEYARARQIFEEALARMPEQPAMANNACFSYYLEAKWPEAEACFKKALARNPKNTAARNNLGLLYCRLGKQDEAYRLWMDAAGEVIAREMMQQAMAALGKAADYAGAAPSPAAPPLAVKPAAPLAPAAPQVAKAPGPAEGKSQPAGTAALAQAAAAAPIQGAPASPPKEQTKAPAAKPKEPAPQVAAAPQPAVKAAIAKPNPVVFSSLKPPAAAPVEHKAEAPAARPAPAPRLTAEELVGTKIFVMNGAGINKLAYRIRSMLHENGFNVARIGNHIDFGADLTIIYYRPEAQKVAQALNVKHFRKASLASSSKLPPGADIKIVLGKELGALDQMAGVQPGPEDG